MNIKTNKTLLFLKSSSVSRLISILKFGLFCFLLLIVSHNGIAQKIKYKADGSLENGVKDGKKYRKLTENVVFTQKDTRVRCDVSYLYKKANIMEAFGNVRVKDGDSVTITSEKLIFEGNNRMARLRENVIYTSGTKKLFTDNLDYNLETKVGSYYGGGKLIDIQNTLTSESGIYYNQTSYAVFKGDVVLVSPKYTLKADTLEYNVTTKVAYTKGRTEIISGGNTTVNANGGEFRTSIEQTLFIGGKIETPDYFLEGDDIFLDDDKKNYIVEGNVLLIAKNNDVILVGNKATYDRTAGISKIYGDAVMKKPLENDTLFLTADTLTSIESEIEEEKRILAFKGVKIFKDNMQGKADSMTYMIADSTIYFSYDPVMWSSNNQIISDSINLVLKNNSIDHMNMRRNAFIISNDTTIYQFNQIKGRNMIGFFSGRRLEKVNVDGNGESLYFAAAENADVLMGMNKIFCSNMLIGFEDNKPKKMTFYQNPEASFIPPHELKSDNTRLEGFSWRDNERPTLGDVVPYYRTLKPIVVEETKESDTEKKAVQIIPEEE